MPSDPPTTIDEHIAGFPAEVQKLPRRVRRTIKKAAPGAEEIISCQIPVIQLHGRYLICFAAHHELLSVYPAPRGAGQFTKALAGYKGGKGTTQFPYDQPLPLDLITRIENFRAKESRQKAAAMKTKK